MRNYKFWSDNEDKVVADLVAIHGSVDGCKKAANQLNRSEESIRKRMYRHIKPKGLVPYKIKGKVDKQLYKKEIEKAIKENPGNISEALREVAYKLDRSENTLMNYYYDKHSVYHRAKLNPCFATVGKCFAPNSKVFKSKPRTQKIILTNVINFLKKLWK